VEAIAGLPVLQIDNAAELLFVELVKDDDAIEPVNELRPEGLLDLAQHQAGFQPFTEILIHPTKKSTQCAATHNLSP
jgi:hypothetical protein